MRLVISLLSLGALLAGPLARDQARAARGAHERLTDAATRGNRVELERAAARLGVGGLARLLGGSDRRATSAAISAAPMVDQSWELLPALARLMRGGDHGLALASARAARRIAGKLRPAELRRFEETPPTIRPLIAPLLAIARDAGVPGAIRVLALLAIAEADAAQLPQSSLLPLLGLKDATQRRAAIQLFAKAPGREALVQLAKLVATEPVPVVARAAMAAVCALPLGSPRDGLTPLAALKQAGAAARLRGMVDAPDASADQLFELGRCLAGLGEPKALRRLRQRLRTLSKARRPARRHR